jgi:hypothetical protein
MRYQADRSHFFAEKSQNVERFIKPNCCFPEISDQIAGHDRYAGPSVAPRHGATSDFREWA